jgi:hypothetical protein
MWPQYWGTRFQDIGIRLGWFLRPFGINMSEETQNPHWLRDRQIYNMAFSEPYKSFMDITPAQSLEIGKYYIDMAELIENAIKKLQTIDNSAMIVQKFIKRQIIPASVLAGFCRTFGNMFEFYGTRDTAAKDEAFKLKRMQQIVDAEVANIDNLIKIFTETPNAIIVADKAWGQCFGKDLVEKLAWKRETMQK